MKLTLTLGNKTVTLETKLRIADGDLAQDHRDENKSFWLNVASAASGALLAQPELVRQLGDMITGRPRRTAEEVADRRQKRLRRVVWAMTEGMVVARLGLDGGEDGSSVVQALHLSDEGKLFAHSIIVSPNGSAHLSEPEELNVDDALSLMRRYAWVRTTIEQGDSTFKTREILRTGAHVILDTLRAVKDGDDADRTAGDDQGTA